MSDGGGPVPDNGDTERLFRATFEQAAVGMAHVGLDGAWMRVNDKVCEIVGYQRDELLGLTFHAVTHPDDIEADLASAAQLLAGEIPTYSVEKRYIRKSGETIWVKLTVALLREADGRPRHFISVIEDIGAQKQAALALRASEERFRAAVQAVHGVLWTNNAAGEMTGEQPGWAALTGQSFAEYQGFGWARAVHPDDAQPTIDAWYMAVAERRPFVFEHRLRRADGALRLFAIRAIPVLADDGEVREWVGVHTDVTQERHDEAELFDSRERLGSIISQAAVGIAQADTTGQFLLVNERQCEILGRSRPEVLAARMFDFTHPDDRPASLAKFARLVETGEPFAIEQRFARPDGTPVWVNSHVSLVRDRAGRPIHVIAVVQDINERKHAEAALRELNERLESRVREEIGKRELAQTQLIQAQRLEAIGKLTGGVAHDFNNLLQVISANLELLRPLVEAAGVKAKGRHDAAGEAVRRGALLTRQLLAFARKQALEPRVLNLGRLVRENAELLRRTLGERIEVEAIVNGGLWNTFADPGQLESALLNLAVNARDAMPEGGRLTLEVANAFLDDRYAAAHTEVTPGQYACIAMSDTGTGMSAETIGRAFEPFFTTKVEGHGTGLGLAQVYGFAKQSGGHVKIYSEPGQGTTVRLYLPRDRRPAEEEVSLGDAAPTGGTETILVVEDDPRVQEAVVETLGSLGYKALRASNAGAALAVLQAGVEVDLVFTDVVMPGPITSVEMARRARDLRPGIAILFTSGYTENSIVHHGRLDPDVELLSKPYARDDLARKIRGMLGRGAAGAVPDAAPVEASPPRLCVLVVEDEALIRMTTTTLIADLGHAAIEAADGAQALALLREDPAIDVLMVDLGLPDMDGRELVARARALRPGMAVIVATGSGELWNIEDTVPLPKPYDETMLRAAFAALPARSNRVTDRSE